MPLLSRLLDFIRFDYFSIDKDLSSRINDFFSIFMAFYKNHFYLLKIIDSGTLPHYLELIMKPLLIRMIFLEEKMIIK